MSRGKIHTLTVRHPNVTTRGAEGTFTQTYTDVVVDGRACSPTRSEQLVHAQTGEQVDCVALVPRATSVARQDRVTVASTGELGLDGEYEVKGIQPNQLHIRVLLSRWAP